MKALVALATALLVVPVVSSCLVSDIDSFANGVCSADQKACVEVGTLDGQKTCVSNNQIAYGCGSKSCEPCDISHAVMRCDESDQCAFVICLTGYGDCDNNLSTNGCEAHLDIDPKNCGGCGQKCNPNPSGLDCKMGVCQTGFARQ